MYKSKMVWMKVEEDEYALPEIVADSAVELARLCGVKPHTIKETIRRSKNSKYVKVVLDDD